MAQQKSQKYNDQSIKALKGADRVRKRPAVIFGSDGLEGTEHAVFEILSNAVDEAREGFGSDIYITAYADKSIEIEDNGRGVPLGWNEHEKRWNWELVYSELYAGGKYDNNSEGSAYEYSLGLNGLGACATQYSSEYFNVKSYNGETVSSINFKKGKAVTKLDVRPIEKREKKTGTIIRWRPDLQVFTDIDIPKEYYQDMLKRQAVVNSGIRFIFKWETKNGFEKEEYYYENGLTDYVEEIASGTNEIKISSFHLETKGRDREDMKDYKLIADIVFTMSKTINRLEYYHNSSWLEHGGAPEKAVKSAFQYAIDKRLKSLGKYNKTEKAISFSDVEECLILVTSSFSTQTSYENQTKKAITNTFIESALKDFLKVQLEYFFAENPIDADKLCNQVLANKKARESAESTRLDLKKKLGSSNNDVLTRVEKFVACRSKDPEKREVYIVEGDSAMSSCKLARDAEFQAVIPVRGKTLNCLKASYDKIFSSAIILDLIRVIGCGVEIQAKHKSDMVKFDINDLKWAKIIICTDADEDGFQIRTLLLTMFYRLLPTLLKEGKVYIAESPLFEITPAKGEIEFAYNEAEKAEITGRFEKDGIRYTLQRSKGLGENNPDMMRKTTMSPATRRLIRIMPSDAEETAKMFDIMLGEDIAGRKQYIAEHGAEYINAADL